MRRRGKADKANKANKATARWLAEQCTSPRPIANYILSTGKEYRTVVRDGWSGFPVSSYRDLEFSVAGVRRLAGTQAGGTKSPSQQRLPYFGLFLSHVREIAQKE